jgi:hypothetical protein
MTNEYHKIDTIFKRDMDASNKPIKMWDWSKPEFQYLSGCEWGFTEKVDGTNIRIMFDGTSVRIGGRTDRAQIHADLYEVLSRMFPVEKMLSEFSEIPEHGGDVTLYGEGYGAGIQGCGGLYRPDKSFVLFDVRIGNWWLKRKDVEEIADALDIECVPVVGVGTLVDAMNMVQDGFESHWGRFTAEGLVCRPDVELSDRDGRRIICKIKHKDFYGLPRS